MKRLASFIFHKLLGWELHGKMPALSKFVIIVVPHTSNMDFLLGVLVRAMLGEEINYIGKESLFRPPHGWIFKALGGAPVDRTGKKDTVKQVARIFREREKFRLALSPEGTRKKVSEWKTGFYYMALEAGVPIVLTAFDYGAKEVRISRPMMPSGNIAEDLPQYKAFFKGVKGRNESNT